MKSGLRETASFWHKLAESALAERISCPNVVVRTGCAQTWPRGNLSQKDAVSLAKINSPLFGRLELSSLFSRGAKGNFRRRTDLPVDGNQLAPFWPF